MDKRILVLPLAAVILTALVAWKLTRTYEAASTSGLAAERPAPLFEGLDSNNEMVRLERYVGRHPVIVVFYDGKAGADESADLLALREHFSEIDAAGAKVIAVSGALPQQNRAAMRSSGSFPFPLVTDVPPEYAVHRRWGRYDESADQPLPGLFFVNRQGNVAWGNRGPQPFNSVDEALAKLHS